MLVARVPSTHLHLHHFVNGGKRKVVSGQATPVWLSCFLIRSVTEMLFGNEMLFVTALLVASMQQSSLDGEQNPGNDGLGLRKVNTRILINNN